MKSIELALNECKAAVDTTPIYDVFTKLTAILEKHSFETFRIVDERLPAKSLIDTECTFIYTVKDLKPSLIQQINAINTAHKAKDRIKAIMSNGGKVMFKATENTIFNDNIIMIDSQMPSIIAQMLIGYYLEVANDCNTLTDYVNHINPLLYNKNFYCYKVKKLLVAIALGMQPTIPWNGLEEALDGYIIVKTNGDIHAYNIYNRDAFSDYLLHNTKFENSDCIKCQHAKLYEENGELLIKLNLQIRLL